MTDAAGSVSFFVQLYGTMENRGDRDREISARLGFTE
jgi:hypothetical protein